MSENILRALMQLFAIIAKVDGVNVIGRSIVQSFLKQQLNKELVFEYIQVFDNYIESIHKISKGADATKKLSLNSVKVLRICSEINKELTHSQKVIVLIRLIEFITSNDVVSNQELEFVDTVASSFNIDEVEYQSCLKFINSNEACNFDSSSILVICNSKPEKLKESKYLYSETLQGQIEVLHIKSVSMYAFRYFGNQDIYLNGLDIKPGRVYILTQGSSIRSTKLHPIFYSDVVSSFMEENQKTKLQFLVKDLEYKFRSGKTGLHPLNFTEESGTLIGIMGGSGAGKSTVLNVLNGLEKPFKGEVLINGINIHTDPKNIEGVIGYISQDDLLIEELTVFQNLFYNAKLCFAQYDDERIKQMVHDLLVDLGLSETANLKVGSPLEKTISGGQRKRLNIGLELIREPSVLFVDEPTSGLSSRDSENIMDLLKELALKGKLVFVVIHQPSSDIYKMFDKLLILDLGGYPIYYGHPVEAVIYFKKQINHANAAESECITCGNVNPEQIFNIIETKVIDEYGNSTTNRKISPLEWNEAYLRELRPEAKKIHKGDIPKSIFKIPNKLKQFKVFITRDVKSKLTNKQYLIINFLETPILALILSYLVRFYNTGSGSDTYKYVENENIPAYLLMAVIIALFVGLTVSAEEIIRDRKILKRESFLNLSKGSYLLSKIVIMFFLSAIQTLTFVLLGNSILGIHGMYTDYWFILFTTSCFANMLGLNVSASFNSAVTIYILIPFLIIPQLILSGVIVKFDKLNPSVTSQTKVPISGEVMASRWAYEALAVNQFMNNAYESNFYKFDKTMSKASYKKDFYLDRLLAKVDDAENLLNDPQGKEQFEYDLRLLTKEISNELAIPIKKNSIKPHYDDLANLVPGKFNKDVGERTKKYLSDLKQYYIKMFNQTNDKREKVVIKLNQKGKDYLVNLRQDYDNDNLNDLLKNKRTTDPFIEINDQLVQKIDPIFLDPPADGFIRAHFFAPRKAFLGNYFDTYWVNSLVIWGMSLIMVITLYFDVLKKLLDGLEKLFSKLKK
ncbi:MAG: ATP-binding cassette domain-containing protein [Bacteroidia bacterium]|nr:ATP-binding cassette domain-containing protein [Bacteroidia bacterium]MCZ2249874.1 ATP-binding cassette domain-containing protein [Bacteroidia bacterium]